MNEPLDPMTFICEFDLYFLEIYRPTGCAKRTSYVKAFGSYRITACESYI